VVKNFAFLELEQKFIFFKGLYIVFMLGFARKQINDLSYQFIDILIKNLNHLYSFGCRKNQLKIYPYHQFLNRVNVVQNESSRNFYITQISHLNT